MLEFISKINGYLNDFIWGPVMLACFLLIGLMFTLRTRWFQITHFGYWLKETIFASITKKEVRKTSDKQAISQFQSLCTALAATFGTGNIAGVATAITAGGPGAVFWMWVSAILGMMTNFAEKTLGIKYRYRDEKGQWVGGAMIYIERGLHCKWLAVIFAGFCALSSFGIGNMTQVNSVADGMKEVFQVPPWVTGALVMILSSLVILGGLKRIASFTEKIVPLMAGLYLLGGGLVIAANYTEVPQAFAMIFKEAFRFQSMAGGVMGYGIAVALRKGISRGVFSNEAGLGSSVIVHSTSDVKEPVVQGMWGIFEVFADTIVVCTITALAIFTSGVYQMDTYLINIKNHTPHLNLTGTALTSTAFERVIPYGGVVVTISLTLFALATIIGWSYYGERCVAYLFGEKAVFPYKLLYIAVIFVGATTPLELVWDISDTLNGFMAVPNLVALCLLSKEVIEMLKDFKERKMKTKTKNKKLE